MMSLSSLAVAGFFAEGSQQLDQRDARLRVQAVVVGDVGLREWVVDLADELLHTGRLDVVAIVGDGVFEELFQPLDGARLPCTVAQLLYPKVGLALVFTAD